MALPEDNTSLWLWWDSLTPRTWCGFSGRDYDASQLRVCRQMQSIIDNSELHQTTLTRRSLCILRGLSCPLHTLNQVPTSSCTHNNSLDIVQMHDICSNYNIKHRTACSSSGWQMKISSHSLAVSKQIMVWILFWLKSSKWTPGVTLPKTSQTSKWVTNLPSQLEPLLKKIK